MNVLIVISRWVHARRVRCMPMFAAAGLYKLVSDWTVSKMRQSLSSMSTEPCAQLVSRGRYIYIYIYVHIHTCFWAIDHTVCLRSCPAAPQIRVFGGCARLNGSQLAYHNRTNHEIDVFAHVTPNMWFTHFMA